jgi:predicted lipid carrier protein YhbT
MTDAAAELFQKLADRRHEPLLEKAIGTIRLDLVDGKRIDRWFVALDKGDVSVSRKNVAADCVVRGDRRLFEAMMRGEVNAMAAYLRGELILEGDPELLVLFQRVLPGPATPSARRGSTGRGRDRR